MAKPDFWNNEKNYYDLKSFWRNRFGCRVYKLQIDAGFTCPNRDGTLATGGCIYCDGRGSRLRQAGALPSVAEQIRSGKDRYRERRQAAKLKPSAARCGEAPLFKEREQVSIRSLTLPHAAGNALPTKFIAYFQTFTNTYGPLEKLQALYDEALAEEDVIGLSVGTRPDCVSDEVLQLLESYAAERHVWLEFGLQSARAETLHFLNRGHDVQAFTDAVERVAGRGIHLCAHIILGLPGETRADMLKTAAFLAALPVQGIKIHALLALRGTALGRLYQAGNIAMMDREEYVSTVCDILELLPPDMVIQRLTADGYRDIFLGPSWATGKLQVLNAIDAELERRTAWQGIRYAGKGIEKK